MKSSKLFLGLAFIPLLLTGCAKAGSQYYDQACAEIKERSIVYLQEKGDNSSVYAPKKYTLTKFIVNYSDGYMANDQWACVINYTIKYDKLDINSEIVEKEQETKFVFYSYMAGELTFDNDKVENYNLLKDTEGSQHIVYEAQKY